MNKMMTAMMAILLAASLNAAETTSAPTDSTESTILQTPWHEKGVMLVLPDGTQVSKMEVVGVLSTMRAIEKRSPTAAANIIKRAHAPDMPLSPGLMKHLINAGLVNEDGTFPPEILDILKTFWTVDDHGNPSPVVPDDEEDQIEEPVPADIE